MPHHFTHYWDGPLASSERVGWPLKYNVATVEGKARWRQLKKRSRDPLVCHQRGLTMSKCG